MTCNGINMLVVLCGLAKGGRTSTTTTLSITYNK